MSETSTQVGSDGQELPESIYSGVVQRPDAEQLEYCNLPLPPINYQIYATIKDLDPQKEWPPMRFKERNKSIGVYRCLWDGDLRIISSTSMRHLRVNVNHFRRVSTIVADLLLTAPIAQLPEVVTVSEMEDAASRALVDQMRFGGSIVVTTVGGTSEYGVDGEFTGIMIDPETIQLSVIDPEHFYPTSDGGYIIVVPFVSNEAYDYKPDMAEVRICDRNGFVYRRIYKWQNNHFGALVEASPEPIEVSSYIIIPRSPLIDGWGTSAFPDIAPLVLEQAIRLSSYSHVLNMHESPTLVYSTALKDVDLLSVDPQTYEKDKRKVEAATGAVRDMRQQDVAIRSLAQTSAEYVEYSGNLGASAFFLQHLHQQISLSTGIPQVLYEGGAFTSGVSLKLMAVALYAQTLTMLERTKLGFEKILSKISDTEVTLDWKHFFDTLTEIAEEQPSTRQNEEGNSPEEVNRDDIT